jgi:BclB C-terminal domain-containing protein
MKTSTHSRNADYILVRVALMCALLIGSVLTSQAQVGIGTTTPHGSAQLDINSSSKGVLIPRLSKDDRDHIASPATGLLIFQTDDTPGFYFYNGSGWAPIAPQSSSGGGSETIIPFSGGEVITTSVNSAGHPEQLSILGFGTSVGITGVTPESTGEIASFFPQSENKFFEFVVPRSGVISAISISFVTTITGYALGDHAPTSSTMTAQLYRNNTNDNVFTQIPGAKAVITSPGSGLGGSPVRATTSNLNIAVNAGDRLVLGFYLVQTGGAGANLNFGQISGFASAGVSIR